MRASRLLVAGLAGALAVAAVGAGAAPPSARAPTKIWVGTVTLTYFRHYVPETPLGPAVEKDSRSVTITNKRDGTASASARVRSMTAYPCSNGTTSGRTEVWDVRAKVSPVRVTFIGNSDRYRVSDANPSKKVQVEERDCFEKQVRDVTVFAMDVGFQLYGRARPGATRLTGEWKHPTTCSGSCVSHGWSGRWDLRLVEAAAGKGESAGTGGRSGGGGSGGRAGGGCEARTRDGTPGDDVLRGTPAAELLRAFAGDDRVAGLAGADCLRGGAGNDLLQGGLGRDLLVGDEGMDVLEGGPGDDELRARDGVAESVRCGAGGGDVAIVDASDRVRGCESVGG